MNADEMVSEALGLEQETEGDFYNTTELYRWLNMGLREFVSNSGILKARFTVAMVEGTQDYAFPSGLIRIEKAFYDTDMTEMEQYDVERLSSEVPGWRGDDNGTPEIIFEELEDYLSVYPKPNADNAGKLITIIGVSDHATVSAGSTTISIARQYHPALVEYLLYRMKLKDDRKSEAMEHYLLFKSFSREAKTQARQANRKGKRHCFFPRVIKNK